MTSEAIFRHVGWRWRGPHGGWIYDTKKPNWHAEAVYVFEENRHDGTSRKDEGG